MRALLAVAALAGCRAERAAESCAATVDEDVRTRVRVTWSVPSEGTSSVVYGDGLSTPEVEGDEGLQEAVLLGIPPLTDVPFRAVTETERGTYVCEGEIRTGGAPAGLPDLFVGQFDESLDGTAPYLMGVLMRDDSTLFAIDRQGRYLWWHEIPQPWSAIDAQVVPGTDQVVYSTFGGEMGVGAGSIGRLSLSGDSGPDLPTNLAHHVFAQIPGGFAYLRGDIREMPDPDTGDLVQVVGDAIVEIDPAGVERVVWSVFDSVEVADLPQPGGLYGAGYVDWTHGNALDYHAPSDTYLYTSAHLTRFFEVSRDGEMLRTFGRNAAYVAEPLSDLVVMPHDAHWTEAGTLLMTGTDPLTNHGGAVEYRVDEAQQRLVKIWSYGFDLGVEIRFLGQARRLRDGNTLVNFGSAGVLHTVTPEGEVAWEIETGLGASFAQVTLFDGLYAAAPAHD